MLVTFIFHMRIRSVFQPMIDYLPLSLHDASKNYPHFRSLCKNGLSSRDSNLRTNRKDHSNIPRGTNRAASVFYEGIETQLDSLTDEQRSFLIQQAFHHYSIRATEPCIWIAQDECGIANDQINDIRLNYPNIFISSVGCNINNDGNITIYKVPPDFDPSSKLRL